MTPAGSGAGTDATLLRDVALTAARTARTLVDASDDHAAVATKSTASDIVTATDLAAEQAIRTILEERAPGSRLLAEEGGHRTLGDGPALGVEWIVDPLDGTVNFSYHVPVAAVSIAAAIGGRPVAAVVVDIARGEEFDAVLGGGARLDGASIRVSDCRVEGDALLATGFAYSPDRRARHGRLIAELVGQVRDVRAFGSAALHLCWVACGRLDAYLERDIRPWDHAAGALIAAEAGARVELPCPENDHLVLAANPALHGRLRSVVAGWRDDRRERAGPD